MPELDVMARRAFVHSDVEDAAIVVLTQERDGLIFGPIIGDRRDGVEGAQIALQRTRRIEIRDRKAALEFRHQDHVHRLRRHGDDLVCVQEGVSLAHAGSGDFDQLIARWAIIGGEIECCADDGLLLLRRRRVRHGWRIGDASERHFRHAVHLFAHADHGRFGAALNFSAREIGLQREAKCCVESFRADAIIGLGGGDQRFSDPGLVLINSGVEGHDSALKTGALGGAELVLVRLDHVGDDGFETGVLRSIGRSVRRRHARGLKFSARLRQQTRDLLHARGRGFQTIRQRRELARHQAIERPTRHRLIAKRVPSPALQRFGAPDVRAQCVVEQHGVDLVGA